MTEAIQLKRFVCLLLVLALTVGTLCGCSHRKKADEASTASPSGSEGAFAPDNGPGYTIVDGSSALSDAGIGDGQPTPMPIETLPPEEIAQEKLEQDKRMTSVTADDVIPADGAAEGIDPAATEVPADADAYVDAALANTDGIVLGTYDEAADAARRSEPAIIDANSYQFAAVMDDNLDYTFYYPVQWVNVPGIYTVCYRAPSENGDFAPRVAITRKRLVHTPDDEALMDQMISYMKSISKQYDKKTFQTSTANKEDTFMGKRAFSNTYLAYWGETEVKGFVIGAAVDRTLYVLHFSASYADYVQLQNVLKYIVQSARPKETEKKK